MEQEHGFSSVAHNFWHKCFYKTPGAPHQSYFRPAWNKGPNQQESIQNALFLCNLKYIEIAESLLIIKVWWFSFVFGFFLRSISRYSFFPVTPISFNQLHVFVILHPMHYHPTNCKSCFLKCLVDQSDFVQSGIGKTKKKLSNKVSPNWSLPSSSTPYFQRCTMLRARW